MTSAAGERAGGAHAAGYAGYCYAVTWNGDAGDWRGLPASQVAANAFAAKPGAIIVFHAGGTATRPSGPSSEA